MAGTTACLREEHEFPSEEHWRAPLTAGLDRAGGDVGGAVGVTECEQELSERLVDRAKDAMDEVGEAAGERF